MVQLTKTIKKKPILIYITKQATDVAKLKEKQKINGTV